MAPTNTTHRTMRPDMAKWTPALIWLLHLLLRRKLFKKTIKVSRSLILIRDLGNTFLSPILLAPFFP